MDHGKVSGGEAAELLRILQMRSLFGTLVRRRADPDQARRMETAFYDALLQREFALVAGDAVLARSRGQACERLLQEALTASRPDPR